MPLKVPLLLKGENQPHGISAYSTDLNPFGIQVETSTPFEAVGPVEIQPVNGFFANAESVKGHIRWIKASEDRFRYGIAFDEVVDWPLPLSSLIQGLCADINPHPYLQQLISNLDDGVVLLDTNLRVIAINSHQPFSPVGEPEEQIGRVFEGIEHLSVPLDGGKVFFKQLIRRAQKEQREIKLSACPIIPAGSSHGQGRYYDTYITPIKELNVLVIRTRDVTALEELKRLKKEKEESFWLQYKYLTLGRLFDDLLEDIINPLSAVVGRLDLLHLKMADARSPIYRDQISSWLSELDMAQKALDNIKEFCRAASRRRYRDVKGVQNYFSLNALIEEELRTLELHSAFKKVRKKLDLSPTIPPIRGEYSDWANAFVSLCQRILQQGGTSEQRELIITTTPGNGHIDLKFTHNGKALPLPLEKEPSLAILELLKKKYGITVCLAGASGNQTIILKIPIQMETQ